MITLIRRILNVSGQYKRRIQAAFVFSFLKSVLAKAPIGIAFLVLSAFYRGTMTAEMSLAAGAGMIACVLLQVVFQHAADRLQSCLLYTSDAADE